MSFLLICLSLYFVFAIWECESSVIREKRSGVTSLVHTVIVGQPVSFFLLLTFVFFNHIH